MANRNSCNGLQEFGAQELALMQQHVIDIQYARLVASQQKYEKRKEIEQLQNEKIQANEQQQILREQKEIQQQQQENLLNIQRTRQLNQKDKIQQISDQHMMTQNLTDKNQTKHIDSEAQQDSYQQQMTQKLSDENHMEHIDAGDKSGQASKIIQHCLVCNAQLWVLSNGVNNGAYDLFEDETRTSHRLFRPIEILEVILKEELVFAPLHTTMICKRCFNLIDEIDEIEVNLLGKREEISSLYFKTKSDIIKDQSDAPGMEDKITVEGTDSIRSKIKHGKVMFDMRSGALVLQKEGTEEVVPAEKVIHVYEADASHNNVDNEDENVPVDDTGPPDYNTDEDNTHVEEDVRQERVLCRLCGASFKTVSHLHKHLNTHMASVYCCHYCQEKFDKAHDLQAHMDQHVNENAGQMNVGQGKEKVSANSNQKGTKKKAKKKPRAPKIFRCPICDKIFQDRKEVQNHRRIAHKGEKPYECDICGNAFTQKGSLLCHKRITHLQEKRFKCDFCEKEFKWKRHLVGHVMSIHTGERPYKCKHCEAAFAYPQHCRKHMRIHTGEKPFICNICGKTFNSSDNCSAHMFTHTNKKKFECLICSVGCMRKIQILDHIKSHGYTEDQNQYYKVNSPGNLHREMGLVGSSPTAAVTEQGRGANVRLTTAKIVRGGITYRERKQHTKHYTRTEPQLLTTEIDYRATSMPHGTIAAHMVLPSSAQTTTVNVPTNIMLAPTGHNTSHRNTGNNMEFYDMPMLFIDSDNNASRQGSTYIVEEI